MVCEEAFLDGLPPFLKDWELIKVSLEDAERKLACNGLVLDENDPDRCRVVRTGE
jgi:hypothetical protein